MTKKEIIDILNDTLKENGHNFQINSNQFETVILDVSRVVDSKITKIINEIKCEDNIKIDSFNREQLRKKILGYPSDINVNVKKYLPVATEEEVHEGFLQICEGFY
ncbi:BslIM [Erysipelothrix rhusiopathiae SY1027]|uniref:hypothetical protein n=1 Tax=Erysipelothrix rhusiopathiae TaxID=1648 RepID=UPI0003348B06|nr:hypothetical protein [Erysipelothrix rhusiopathiae]AGN24554.1 BslIM [Erysipelothrix rhusiopathiae SY1027]